MQLNYIWFNFNRMQNMNKSGNQQQQLASKLGGNSSTKKRTQPIVPSLNLSKAHPSSNMPSANIYSHHNKQKSTSISKDQVNELIGRQLVGDIENSQQFPQSHRENQMSDRQDQFMANDSSQYWMVKQQQFQKQGSSEVDSEEDNQDMRFQMSASTTNKPNLQQITQNKHFIAQQENTQQESNRNLNQMKKSLLDHENSSKYVNIMDDDQDEHHGSSPLLDFNNYHLLNADQDIVSSATNIKAIQKAGSTKIEMKNQQQQQPRIKNNINPNIPKKQNAINPQNHQLNEAKKQIWGNSVVVDQSKQTSTSKASKYLDDPSSSSQLVKPIYPSKSKKIMQTIDLHSQKSSFVGTTANAGRGQNMHVTRSGVKVSQQSVLLSNSSKKSVINSSNVSKYGVTASTQAFKKQGSSALLKQAPKQNPQSVQLKDAVSNQTKQSQKQHNNELQIDFDQVDMQQFLHLKSLNAQNQEEGEVSDTDDDDELYNDEHEIDLDEGQYYEDDLNEQLNNPPTAMITKQMFSQSVQEPASLSSQLKLINNPVKGVGNPSSATKYQHVSAKKEKTSHNGTNSNFLHNYINTKPVTGSLFNQTESIKHLNTNSIHVPPSKMSQIDSASSLKERMTTQNHHIKNQLSSTQNLGIGLPSKLIQLSSSQQKASNLDSLSQQEGNQQSHFQYQTINDKNQQFSEYNQMIQHMQANSQHQRIPSQQISKNQFVVLEGAGPQKINVSTKGNSPSSAVLMQPSVQGKSKFKNNSQVPNNILMSGAKSPSKQMFQNKYIQQQASQHKQSSLNLQSNQSIHGSAGKQSQAAFGGLMIPQTQPNSIKASVLSTNSGSQIQNQKQNPGYTTKKLNNTQKLTSNISKQSTIPLGGGVSAQIAMQKQKQTIGEQKSPSSFKDNTPQNLMNSFAQQPLSQHQFYQHTNTSSQQPHQQQIHHVRSTSIQSPSQKLQPGTSQVASNVAFASQSKNQINYPSSQQYYSILPQKQGHQPSHPIGHNQDQSSTPAANATSLKQSVASSSGAETTAVGGQTNKTIQQQFHNQPKISLNISGFGSFIQAQQLQQQQANKKLTGGAVLNKTQRTNSKIGSSRDHNELLMISDFNQMQLHQQQLPTAHVFMSSNNELESYDDGRQKEGEYYPKYDEEELANLIGKHQVSSYNQFEQQISDRQINHNQNINSDRQFNQLEIQEIDQVQNFNKTAKIGSISSSQLQIQNNQKPKASITKKKNQQQQHNFANKTTRLIQANTQSNQSQIKQSQPSGQTNPTAGMQLKHIKSKKQMIPSSISNSSNKNKDFTSVQNSATNLKALASSSSQQQQMNYKKQGANAIPQNKSSMIQQQNKLTTQKSYKQMVSSNTHQQNASKQVKKFSSTQKLHKVISQQPSGKVVASNQQSTSNLHLTNTSSVIGNPNLVNSISTTSSVLVPPSSSNTNTLLSKNQFSQGSPGLSNQPKLSSKVVYGSKKGDYSGKPHAQQSQKISGIAGGSGSVKSSPQSTKGQGVQSKYAQQLQRKINFNQQQQPNAGPTHKKSQSITNNLIASGPTKMQSQKQQIVYQNQHKSNNVVIASAGPKIGIQSQSIKGFHRVNSNNDMSQHSSSKQSSIQQHHKRTNSQHIQMISSNVKILQMEAQPQVSQPVKVYQSTVNEGKQKYHLNLPAEYAFSHERSDSQGGNQQNLKMVSNQVQSNSNQMPVNATSSQRTLFKITETGSSVENVVIKSAVHQSQEQRKPSQSTHTGGMQSQRVNSKVSVYGPTNNLGSVKFSEGQNSKSHFNRSPIVLSQNQQEYKQQPNIFEDKYDQEESEEIKRNSPLLHHEQINLDHILQSGKPSNQLLHNVRDQRNEAKYEVMTPQDLDIYVSHDKESKYFQSRGANLLIQTHGLKQENTQMTIQTDVSNAYQRDLNKLKKLIQVSFKKYQEMPTTTQEFYRVGRVLGRGAFGKVCLASHKLAEQIVAIKSLNKEQLKNENEQRKRITQEVAILKQSNHPGVVRLYDQFETDKHICFVMELCSGGDLLSYVRKRRKLKEDVAKYFFKQLIEGLAYIHYFKLICHRDIKLDNLLLDNNGKIKICDFGVAKQLKSETEKMTEQCGTPAYIAPEILKDKAYSGFKCDIWSAGVCLYAMLVGTVPFKASSMEELHQMIEEGKIDLKEENFSKEAKDLIQKLIQVDSNKRLNAFETLNHPWMKDAQDTLDVFTEKEKDIIQKEYLQKNFDSKNLQNQRAHSNLTPNYLNNHNNIYQETQDLLFTEHNLETKSDHDPGYDSQQNSLQGNKQLLKNHSSKSIILAPFNSTVSQETKSKSPNTQVQKHDALEKINKHFEWPQAVIEQIMPRKTIKYSHRCRDANREYENNNNADLDNGVYNVFINEQEEEEKKFQAMKQQKIQNGEDLDQQSSQSQQLSHFSHSQQRPSSLSKYPLDYDEELEVSVRKELDEQRRKQKQKSQMKGSQVDISIFEQKVRDKITTQQYENNLSPQGIDQKIIEHIQSQGFLPQNYVKNLLIEDSQSINYVSAYYHLLLKKKQEQQSISNSLFLQSYSNQNS